MGVGTENPVCVCVCERERERADCVCVRGSCVCHTLYVGWGCRLCVKEEGECV